MSSWNDPSRLGMQAVRLSDKLPCIAGWMDEWAKPQESTPWKQSILYHRDKSSAVAASSHCCHDHQLLFPSMNVMPWRWYRASESMRGSWIILSTDGDSNRDLIKRRALRGTPLLATMSTRYVFKLRYLEDLESTRQRIRFQRCRLDSVWRLHNQATPFPFSMIHPTSSMRGDC